MVCDADGGAHGAVYKWRADNSDADLLATNLTEEIEVATAAGPRTQTWYYPSRQDCLTCHTAKAGVVLGVKTRQLNRDVVDGNGRAENQLAAWNRMGLFEPGVAGGRTFRRWRVWRGRRRRRGVWRSARDRIWTPIARIAIGRGERWRILTRVMTRRWRDKGLIRGQILIDEGIDGAEVIAPHDIWRSILLLRASAVDAVKMPPLAHNVADRRGAALLREWIESMPGPPVLAPPEMAPGAGHFAGPIDVTLKEAVAGASIHYTLDGSLPTKGDPVYEKPIRLAGPTIVRAKAFKPGYTKSITAQEVYAIGD